jgi:hypothetical protein
MLIVNWLAIIGVNKLGETGSGLRLLRGKLKENSGEVGGNIQWKFLRKFEQKSSNFLSKISNHQKP